MENNDIRNSLIELAKAFSNLASSAVEKVKSLDFSPLLNFIKEISDSFKEIEVSEARQKILIERYVSYGRYGWTIPPTTPLVLKRKATSLNQADTYMSKFCTLPKMKEIFQKLLESKKINTSDVNEAILCYKHKHYKGCVLLLFSIIDGLLIKLQKVGKEKRTVKTAKEKINELVKDKEQYLLLFLHSQNIVACIDSIYDSPRDFKKHFDFINRDTTSHGMLDRNVAKLDCNFQVLSFLN